FPAGPALDRLIGALETVLRSARPHFLRGPVPGLARDATMVNMPALDAEGRVRWILHRLEFADAAAKPREQPGLALALEAAEARLRSIMQTVPDAMIIIDERGRIESLSTTAERLFGYSMTELAGRNVSQLMPSPDREQHDTYLKRYLSTGERRIIGIG